jgi:hypothetical protein
MSSLQYFMWPFQRSFRVTADFAARKLFELIDPRLAPRVFLVGALVTDRTDRHPVCVVPEDWGYRPDMFDSLREHAQALRELTPAQLYRDPGSYHSLSHRCREVRSDATDAVLRGVEQNTDASAWVVFCSWATLVGDYVVCAVLQLDRKAYDSIPRVRKNSVDDMRVQPSLVDAAVDRYLEACAKELSRDEPGSELALMVDVNELMRAAGSHFMYTVSVAGKNLEGLHGLFDTCNTIGSLKYEGEASSGRLIIAPREHPNVAVELSLADPIPLREYRAIRKLLQLATGNLCLLSDSEKAHGLGRLQGKYDPAQQDLFVIHFLKHHVWEVQHDGQPLMRTSYGEPRVPQQEFWSERFKQNLPRLFKGISPSTVEELCGLAQEAVKQKHGTMLVISAGAESEARRLEKQCIRVQPARMTREILGLATAIDGAVLLDPHGVCHAIGVILDGRASPKGTPARGARYNSAIRYIDGCEYRCMAVVISEDGMIDLFPDYVENPEKAGLG